MNLLSKAKRMAVFAALTLTLTLSSASLPRVAGMFKCERVPLPLRHAGSESFGTTARHI